MGCSAVGWRTVRSLIFVANVRGPGHDSVIVARSDPDSCYHRAMSEPSAQASVTISASCADVYALITDLPTMADARRGGQRDAVAQG